MNLWTKSGFSLVHHFIKKVKRLFKSNSFSGSQSFEEQIERMRERFRPPKPNIKDFLKPSQIQHVIDKSSDWQGTKKPPTSL